MRRIALDWNGRRRVLDGEIVSQLSRQAAVPTYCSVVLSRSQASGDVIQTLTIPVVQILDTRKSSETLKLIKITEQKSTFLARGLVFMAVSKPRFDEYKSL